MLRRMVRAFLLLVAVSVFLFSGTMVFRYQTQMHESAQSVETLIRMAVTKSAAEPEGKDAADTADQPTEIVQAQTGTKAKLESFAKAPIQVDFDALRSVNPDVIAWIYSPDTPINYPVVQAGDNAYYLHRLPDGSENKAGTLFMDYRNAADLSDWNSVIYGHNMKNGSMFGMLQHYKKQSYYESHPEIFLLTPECDYVIDVAAGFVTPGNGDIYNAFGMDDGEKARLIEKWMASSDFVSEICPTVEDRLITFSTCSYEYDEARYVIIGTLKRIGD